MERLLASGSWDQSARSWRTGWSATSLSGASKGISREFSTRRLPRALAQLVTTMRKSQVANWLSPRNVPRLRMALTKVSWRISRASSWSRQTRMAKRYTWGAYRSTN